MSWVLNFKPVDKILKFDHRQRLQYISQIFGFVFYYTIISLYPGEGPTELWEDELSTTIP